MPASSATVFKLNNSLLKFLVVGVLNTGLSMTIIFAMKYFYSVGDVVANLTGYIVGLMCSFVLNKKWTFNHAGQLSLTAFKFLIIFIVAYTVNIMCVLLFISADINPYFSHMSGMPIYTIIFYLGSKFFVFR